MGASVFLGGPSPGEPGPHLLPVSWTGLAAFPQGCRCQSRSSLQHRGAGRAPSTRFRGPQGKSAGQPACRATGLGTAQPWNLCTVAPSRSAPGGPGRVPTSSSASGWYFSTFLRSSSWRWEPRGNTCSLMQESTSPQLRESAGICHKAGNPASMTRHGSAGTAVTAPARMGSGQRRLHHPQCSEETRAREVQCRPPGLLCAASRRLWRADPSHADRHSARPRSPADTFLLTSVTPARASSRQAAGAPGRGGKPAPHQECREPPGGEK